jgi:protein gp37
MSGPSDIEWTDATWNPVAGCTLASAGCTNCYAMRMAARLEAMGHPKYAGTTRKSGGRFVWSGKVNVDPASLDAPLQWKRPKRIFVNSMSDLFHEGVPTEFIRRVWNVMEQCPQHHFQVLTKRPNRMADLFSSGALMALENVWIGTSVESAEVVERIDHLAAIPAMTRFVSFEPLIGPVGNVDLSRIHWAIVGGESGPKARSIEPQWIEELRKLCRRDDVAFFFKQWGGKNKKATGRMLNGRTYDEYPVQLIAP